MTATLVANIASPISSSLSKAFSADAVGLLSNYGRLGVADPDAAIKALFAAGEQGAWYDPSDLTTMFQDRFGTTPVTADGQTVGLILDKSNGLVLGSELAAIPTTGLGSGAWTIAGGVIQRNGATSGIAIAACPMLSTSKTYIASFTVSDFSGDSFIVRLGGSPYVRIAQNGNYSIRTLGGGSDGISFAPYSGPAGQASITNLSVKELPGNHAVAPSDAARPLRKGTGLSKWIDYDGVDDVVNSTFASSLGASCTVARANVGGAPTILTGQTITTTYASSTDHAGLIIVNRALTADETTNLTTWLTAKGATS